jgi:hypothetical protein
MSVTGSDIAEALWLAPLGVPLRVEVRPGDCGKAVEAACRGWDRRPANSPTTLELTLVCDPAWTGTSATVVEVTGRQLALVGEGVTGRACADRRKAWCTVSGAWLAAPEQLRADVIEPLVLFLVARNGRVPLHASAIKVGELAVLLMGPSGSGKSSLALAAEGAGLTVLSEDTTYVQRDPKLQIWGSPGPVHLLPIDGAGTAGSLRWRNGRLKEAVPVRQPAPDALTASRATVCLLARGDAVALEPLDPDQALARMPPLEPGFDLLAADIRDASARLVQNGAWRLTLSANPAEAIELLSAHLPRLRQTAA